MSDNGKEINLDKLDTNNPKEIIEAMVKFMKQTNELLCGLIIKISNQQVDIDKLKKHIKDKDSNLIITRR